MNKAIKISVTPFQNQLIMDRAEKLGYRNRSAFARDMLLRDDHSIEKMIGEIYDVVCGNPHYD